MFKKPTAFILGAGASWHYGYPTGEKLVYKILENLNKLLGHINNFSEGNPYTPDYIVELTKEKLKLPPEHTNELYGDFHLGWRLFKEKAETLLTRIKDANPLVIDHFLGKNEDVSVLAKMLIAWVILECEHESHQHKRNENRRDDYRNIADPGNKGRVDYIQTDKFRDDWCRFVIHQLMDCEQPIDLLNNKVDFITFNYDLSLESRLSSGLKVHSFFEGKNIDAFLNQHIHHLYGKVRDDGIANIILPSSVNDRNYQQNFRDFLNQITAASKGIKTISPIEKGEDKITFQKAKDILSKAKVVYILGYGFDNRNSSLLDLNNYLSESKNKHVMFTNFENSNRINKKASKIFFNSSFRRFLQEDIHGSPQENSSYFEKSTKDVYRALEVDFDSLESNE